MTHDINKYIREFKVLLESGKVIGFNGCKEQPQIQTHIKPRKKFRRGALTAKGLVY